MHIGPRRHSQTIWSVLFLMLFSAGVSYAVPPATPYQPGETLDPSCMPGDANCFVQILPDQTGQGGRYLTTDGDVTSWAVLPAGYNDENAQDAIGTILSSEFSYDDLTPLISINTVGAAKITGTKTATFISDFSAAVQAVGDVRYAPINSGVTSFNGRTGAVSPGASDYTTSLVAEGTNLYFTAPRAVTALTGANISIFNNDAGYLTSYTETDPSVPSYVKSLTSFSVIQSSTDALYPSMSGTGATGTWGISVSGNAATVTNGLYSTGSYTNPSWITSLAWSKLTGTPTTLFGYGITDAYTQTEVQNFFAGTTAITGYNKSNWDTAYGWGNHATQGYLTDMSSFSTTDLAEGTNLYYTNARADARIALAVSGTTNYIPKFTGANTVGNSLVYDNGTNVGIGVVSPNSLLHLTQANIPRITLTKTGIISWYLGNSDQSSSNVFSIGTDSGGNDRILNIVNTGNVGIGTTVPGYKLDVAGDANFAGTINANAGQSNTIGATPFLASPSGYNLFRQGLNRSFNFDVLNGGSPVTAFTILQSGNIGMGITTPSVKLMVVDTVNNTAFGIQGAGATTILGLGSRSGLPAVQAHTAGFGGTANLLLNPDGGNIGIGTATPSNKLSIVQGTASGGTLDAGYGLGIDGNGISGIHILSSNAQSGRIVFGDSDAQSRGSLAYYHSDDSMRFTTAGAVRMLINSSGNVGIGNSATNARLEVSSSTGEVFRADAAAGAYRIIANQSGVVLGGNVGIGTISPNAKLVVNNGIDNAVGFSLLGVGGNSRLNIGTDASANTYIRSQNSTSLFLGVDTTNMITMLAGGNVGIGTASPISTLVVSSPNSSTISIHGNTDSTGYAEAGTVLVINGAGHWQNFIYTNPPAVDASLRWHSYSANASVMVLSTAGNLSIAGTLTQSSDYRLKENIKLLDGQSWSLQENITMQNDTVMDRIMALRPVTYTMKADTSGQVQPGFIAQEVRDIFPDLVTLQSQPKGGGSTYALNYVGLVPYTIAAIQEMNMNMLGIADLGRENALRESMKSWLANASNRITRIFTGEICLTDTDGSYECINRAELKQLKSLLSNTSSGSSSTGTVSTDPALPPSPVTPTTPPDPETPPEPPVEPVTPPVVEPVVDDPLPPPEPTPSDTPVTP